MDLIAPIVAKQLLLIIYLCAVFVDNGWAATYYVDASAGNDSNTGTSPAGAWQGIDKVNQAFLLPGDKVLFKRGESWHDSLVVRASGTGTEPVIFSSYGDADQPLPLLDCTAGVEGEWTEIRTNIFSISLKREPGVVLYKSEPRPAVTTLKFSHIPASPALGAVLLQLDDVYANLLVTGKTEDTVSGITFFNFRKDKNVYVRQAAEEREEQWPAGLGMPQTVFSLDGLTEPGFWCWRENRLYIFSDKPPAPLVRVGCQAYAVQIQNRHDVEIHDLTIRGCNEGGILLMNAEGVSISNVHIFGTGSRGHKTGLLLFNSSGNIISANVVDTVLKNGIAVYAEGGGRSRNNRIFANIVSNSGSAGISLSSGRDPASVTDNIIEANIVSGANHLSYDAAGIYTLQAGSNTIRGNTIRNCGDRRLRSSGIMADGWTDSLLIEANIIENNSFAGIAVSGSGHLLKNNRLANNGHASWDSAQIVFFPVNKNAAGCTVTGNTMLAGKNQKLFLVTKNPRLGDEAPHHIDNNSYYGKSAEAFCWSKSWSCDKWLDFSAWQKISGQDGRSVFSR